MSSGNVSLATKVKERMTLLPGIFFGRGKSFSPASIAWPRALFAHLHHFEILYRKNRKKSVS